MGDKTLVDALEPFAVTLQERFDGGDGLETAWDAAVSTARSAAAATADIAARMGRSRVLGAKSLGSPDPGATSLAAVMGALAPVVTRRHASSLSWSPTHPARSNRLTHPTDPLARRRKPS